MIPRRVSLRGFLCYREEQEIDFSGASLWMLAGLNGSGKSAIFDALTFALFGHHRGGARDALELINKESDGFQVEFDFLLDDALYRAKRTTKKTKRGNPQATQEISRFENGKWTQIPDTNRKTGCDAWIREHLGLTYETFTSSVLLLQGRAEKLLDSTAKGRFEVLAGIVDLERYMQLHQLADDRRRQLKATVESLEHQLSSSPPVAPEEAAAAEDSIAKATAARAEAATEVQRWQAAEFVARRWAELQTKASGLAQRWQKAQVLLAEANVIERAAERSRELKTVLPHAETAIKQGAQLSESQRKSDALATQLSSIQEQAAASDHAVRQANLKRTALQTTIATDEKRHAELAARVLRYAQLLGKLTTWEAQQAELGRVESEVARLPADIEVQVVSLQSQQDDLTRLAAAVPLLAGLSKHRIELSEAREREQKAAARESVVKTHGEGLTAEIDKLLPRIEAAATSRQQADDGVSAAKALLVQAQDEETGFRELRDARACSQCGQELTAAHFDMELTRRREIVAEAESRLQKAVADQVVAQKAEAELRKHLAEWERQRQAKRDEYRDAHQQLEQARRDGERCVRDCAAVYRDIAEPFRSRIAPMLPDDWLAIVYPTEADVEAARLEIAKLDTLRARLVEARKQHDRFVDLQGQAKTLRAGLEALKVDLPGEPEELRRDHARAASDETALVGTLKAARAEAKTVQDDLDRLATKRQEIEAQLAAINNQSAIESSTRKLCRQHLDSALAALPESWRIKVENAGLSELHGWKAERESLIGQDAEGKAQELQTTRAAIGSLEQARTDIDRDIESIPADGRRPLDEVRTTLDSARTRAASAEKEERQAHQAKAILDERQRRRGELQVQSLAADREHILCLALTQCLSRERLQLHLVRQAERQIVDHANSVLDRLSGGQLFLRLRAGEEGQEPEQALELEACNRVTGGKAINVAFLSGSQRFRVAVSLALGIGQYASRQHRPIESVIIDEGFGCLDRNGRQVMIQELHNLRGQLKCILLVSHQEEFADAFNDGYRFELVDGTTHVTRFQR